MVEELIKRLLESGVHFGHQTSRWNPKMARFIFGQRSGIYIIDLEKTAENLKKAQEFVRDLAAKGGKILFVGTKKQAQMIIEEEAKRSGMYYITNRWMGGLLTNFQTVRKSIGRLEEIENMSKNGIWENLKKKETSQLTKEKDKLDKDLRGIREMRSLPDAVFIVDPKNEEISVKEAMKLGIPIIAIVDTNCNPDLVNYPIPGNDDALKSIRVITSLIAESVLEGAKEYKTSREAKQAAEAKAQEAKGQVKQTDTSTLSGQSTDSQQTKEEAAEQPS